ncbi:hypothetical protein HDK77DRAFT_211805 [Phyllosticta capitalensis]
MRKLSHGCWSFQTPSAIPRRRSPGVALAIARSRAVRLGRKLKCTSTLSPSQVVDPIWKGALCAGCCAVGAVCVLPVPAAGNCFIISLFSQCADRRRGAYRRHCGPRGVFLVRFGILWRVCREPTSREEENQVPYVTDGWVGPGRQRGAARRREVPGVRCKAWPGSAV